MRKFKVLQPFHSVYMSGAEGQVVDNHTLDDYTVDNWVENGLIEEIKETKKKPKKVVTDDENESSDNQ